MNDIQTLKNNNLTTIDDEIKAIIADDTEIKAAILKNPDYVKRLLQESIIDEIKADIAQKKAVMRYDYQKETADFLERCGLKSKHTEKAYRYALQDFEQWTLKNGIESPFLISPDIADSYIIELQKQGKAAATIRQHIGGLSAFFGNVERKSKYAIKNCFRGSRVLPKKKPTKRIENEIPTENLKQFKKDVMTIINAEQDKELKTMIVIMAFRGLRAGSFQNMTFHGGKFFTTSKGKEISGALPTICIDAIKQAGLSKNNPFAKWNSAKVSSTFQYHIGKLYAAGKISYKYSAHDLRHFFALSEYTRNKDIYALSKLLGHSSISVTEIYLRGLKVDTGKTA